MSVNQKAPTTDSGVADKIRKTAIASSRQLLETVRALGRHANMQSKEIRRLATQFDAVTRLTNDAVIVFDAHGRIESANVAAEIILGPCHRSLAGTMLADWLGISLAQLTDHASRGTPLVLERSQSRSRALEIVVHPMRSEGTVLNVACIRDFTELTETRHRLAALSFLIDNVDSFVLTATPSGKIDWCNACLEDLTGLSIAQVRGQPALEVLVHPDTPAETYARLAAAVENARSITTELLLKRADNRSRWVRVECYPYFGKDGRLRNYVVMGRDVSQTRRPQPLLSTVRNKQTSTPPASLITV